MSNIESQLGVKTENVIKSNYSPLRLIGILTLTAFCTVLLITATFTRIKFFNLLQPVVAMLHPANFPDISSVFTLKPYFYVPQIPVILFATALLSGACAMTSVFFYIVIGLAFLPVFGLGGGFEYVLEPTFGYILAFLPATIVAGFLIDKEHSAKSLFKAAIAAVLTIHILGFFYMLLILLLKHEHFAYIVDWLIFESFTRAIYDVAIGFLCMLFAKLCRKFIWIITAV